MNSICKYVNTTNAIRSTKNFLFTKKYTCTQSTHLRHILDVTAKELNMTHLNDWYLLSAKDYTKLFGSDTSESFEKEFNSSPYQLLSTVYPEHDWMPWKFEQSLKGYWSDINNVRKFMNWAAKQLNVKEMSDWYNVSSSDFKKIGGRYLIKLKTSYVDLLTEAYPEYNWLPWKFERCPQGFWSDINNVRKFMNWAAKQLNVKEIYDWYNISYRDLSQVTGGAYLLETRTSYFDLLTEVYPEYNWLPWKFEQCPPGYWKDINNVRKFMEWAGDQLNVKDMSDWYNISSTELSKITGGAYLLELKTYVSILTEVYPEYNWLLYKFNSFSSKNLITNPTKKQQYVKWIARQLNIKEMSDWYNIKPEQIIDLNGGILMIDSRTLPNLLSQVYSEFKWDESKFEQQSDILSVSLINYYVEWLKTQNDKEISIVCQYVKENVTKGDDRAALGRSLQTAFPNKWTKTSTQNSKKSQYILKDCISIIFDRDNNDCNTLILEDYKHPDVINLELDYYLPEHKIAFEYQGQQHYRTTGIHQRQESIETIRERDRSKLDSCKELGITVIEVPYWWDRSIPSLAATIYNLRPDLFDSKPYGNPIPSSPPQKQLSNNQNTSISKQVLMTATVWDYDTMEPTGWYLTEKYDGMRFYWDGTQCYSRQGNKINVPYPLAKQLPPVALDGELWTQHGLHQEAVTLMNTTKEEKWSKAIFWIFDAPHLNKPLDERIDFLTHLNLPSFAKVVEFVKCEGKEHLKQFSDSIIDRGGEGVVLREPGSFYKSGRSTGLRKFKPFLDTEVRVLRNQYPQGFTCEQLNGRIVFVNTENSEQAKSIKRGSVITVKHNGTNAHGTLLYPQFYRERLDVTWNELLNKVV